MDRILERGALLVLPLLFCAHLAAAVRTPVDLYRVFYLPLSEASIWMAKEKGDAAKDLFLARHHLPLKARGAVTIVPVTPVKSYAGDQEYFHLYLEAVKKSSFVLTLAGVAKGTIAVNGEQKGTIALVGPADQAKIEVTFAPGVYALLFTIEKRQEGMPVILLSDKPLVFSARGFTQSFSSSVRVTARAVTDGAVMARLYRAACLPAPQDDEKGRAAWQVAFEMPVGDFAYDEKQPLIVLLRNAANEKARAALVKFGIDETMLAWWRELFENGGICADEE
jgi:hypothetical protein